MIEKNRDTLFSGDLLKYKFICILTGSDYARGETNSLLDSCGYHGWN